MWLSAILTLISLVLLIHFDISTLTHRKRVSNLLYHNTPVSCTPDPINNGKIVFISCPVEYIESIYVPKEFSSNIYSYDGAFLDTKVDVYQWTHRGGFLKKEWIPYLTQGSLLQRLFFPKLTFIKYFPVIPGQGRKFVNKLKVGGFILRSSELSSLTKMKQLDLIDDGWYNKEVSTNLPITYVNYTNTRVHGKGLYTGEPSNPKIGDLKITFWGSDVSHISAMGKQSSSMLKGFNLEPIDFMDEKLVLVKEGAISPSALVYSYLERYQEPRFYVYLIKIIFITSASHSLRTNIFEDNDKSLLGSLFLFFIFESLVWSVYSILKGVFYFGLAILVSFWLYYLWKNNKNSKEADSKKVVNLNIYESMPWENSIDTEGQYA